MTGQFDSKNWLSDVEVLAGNTTNQQTTDMSLTTCKSMTHSLSDSENSNKLNAILQIVVTTTITTTTTTLTVADSYLQNGSGACPKTVFSIVETPS